MMKQNDKKPTSLGDIVKVSGDDFDRLLKVAVDAYSSGDHAQADTILLGLVAVSGKDARPFKVLGSSLLLQERHIEAERVYEEALARDPDDPYTLVALAELKLQAMRIEEGVSLLERLLARPDNQTHPAANRGRRLAHEFHRKLSGAR